jgi:putative endonuclease
LGVGKETTKQIGHAAEQMAAEFLERQGYKVLSKNYRYRRSEIDLIVQKGTMVIFVEVKYRSNSTYGHPETFVSNSQISRIGQAATAFMEKNGLESMMRYDVVSVSLAGATPVIRHFTDAIN